MFSDSFVDFSSGYFTRAASQLPKQGKEFPWKLHQNYGKDIQLLRYGSLDDEAMCFEDAHKVERAKDAPALLEAAE